MHSKRVTSLQRNEWKAFISDNWISKLSRNSGILDDILRNDTNFKQKRKIYILKHVLFQNLKGYPME